MKLSFRNLAAVSAVAAILATSCDSQEKKHVKQVTFPADATMEQKVEMASNLVPEPKQLAWQDLEMTAFLHFGVNTFTDREWGEGTEDPNVFNPVGLDTDQWVKTLKDAGFKLVMLTAKHHDGFCLWPTATTAHSVASSPWRNGKGDIVGELRVACEKYGLRFGVYLSPWDRNAPCYGDSPRYNEFFIAQLTELLTRYGRIDEVWFDGACAEGPNGRRQEYDWEAYYRTIRRLQPEAVAAIKGDDIRWVGNEGGLGRATEWSATVLAPGGSRESEAANARLGIDEMTSDLGSRAMLERAERVYWYPSEVDVSIRPGWFHHSAEDTRVKSLRQLADIYFRSVGCNSLLLLNIPPDRRGRIHEADSTRLAEFAAYLRRAFADDRTVDGERLRQADAGESLEYRLAPGSRINTVLLQEQIAKGQRVEAFVIETLAPDGWRQVGEGTTIGYKRLVRIPETETDRLRITVVGTRLRARISRIAAYLVPEAEPLVAETEDGLLPRTAWRRIGDLPLTLDLGASHTLRGFVYAPQEASVRAAYRYRFEVSADGSAWTTAVAESEFGNIMYNAEPRRIVFKSPLPARYIRFTAATVEGAPARIAPEEISLFR